MWPLSPVFSGGECVLADRRARQVVKGPQPWARSWKSSLRRVVLIGGSWCLVHSEILSRWHRVMCVPSIRNGNSEHADTELEEQGKLVTDRVCLPQPCPAASPRPQGTAPSRGTSSRWAARSRTSATRASRSKAASGPRPCAGRTGPGATEGRRPPANVSAAVPCGLLGGSLQGPACQF